MADAVAIRFGLPSLVTPSVELADRLAVFLEMRDLMVGKPMKYGREVARPDLTVLHRTIVPQGPELARAAFLARAAELGIS
jgi:hypothetical protein